jgi:hypothetical protein
MPALQRFPRVLPVRLLTLACAAALTVASLPGGAGEAAAQDTVSTDTATAAAERMYAIRLRDGTTVLGRAADANADPLVVTTAHGTLRIPRADIAQVTPVAEGSMQNGEYWPPSPNETRLLFAPTGRLLRKGEGYFSNTYLFFQHVAGGMTNNFTMGGGMSLFPSDDLTQNVFYLTPKLGVYNSERTNVAVGVLAGYLPDMDDYDGDGGDSFGIVYGVSTFGSPDGHVTVGTGLGYANGDLGEDPMFMVGGEKRVARRASLVTENYFFPTVSDDFTNIVSYGVRFFGERLSVDLAFINSLGEDTIFPGLPYVSFAVKF